MYGNKRKKFTETEQVLKNQENKIQNLKKPNICKELIIMFID